MAHSMFSADALPRGEKKMKRAGGGWARLGQSMSVSAALALAGGITVGTGSHARATTEGYGNEKCISVNSSPRASFNAQPPSEQW